MTGPSDLVVLPWYSGFSNLPFYPAVVANLPPKAIWYFNTLSLKVLDGLPKPVCFRRRDDAAVNFILFDVQPQI